MVWPSWAIDIVWPPIWHSYLANPVMWPYWFLFYNNPFAQPYIRAFFSQCINPFPRGFDFWSDRIQAFNKGRLPADLWTVDDLIRPLRTAGYLRSCSRSTAVAPAGECRQLASELANWQNVYCIAKVNICLSVENGTTSRESYNFCLNLKTQFGLIRNSKTSPDDVKY